MQPDGNFTTPPRVKPSSILPPADPPPVPVGVELFFDRIQARTTSIIPRALLAQLNEHCREIAVFGKDEDKLVTIPVNGVLRAFPYRYALVVPDREIFRLLKAWPRETFVNEVELSLNLLCDDWKDVRRIQHYVLRHLHWPFRRSAQREVRSSKDTTTYDAGAKWRGVHAVMYGDRVSKKLSRKPCCHIEFRMNGRQLLRRKGLASLPELEQFDLRRFWLEQFQLRYLTLSSYKLALMLCGRDPRSKLEYASQANLGATFLHAACLLGTSPTFMEITTAMRQWGFDPSRYSKRIENYWLEQVRTQIKAYLDDNATPPIPYTAGPLAV